MPIGAETGIIVILKTFWKHRKKLANLGELPEVLQENERLEGRVKDLGSQVQGLEEQVAELTLRLDTKESLSFEHNAYWTTNQSGNREDPFCPTCWDTKKIQVHMARTNGMLWCQACDTKARDPDVPPQTPPHRTRRGSSWPHGY